MKSSSPTPRSRVAASIEPLEARIAPARVIWINLTSPQGQNVDIHYSNPSYFVDTFAHQTDAGSISAAVGGFHSTDPNFSAHPDETFYLPLSAGDTVIVGTAKTPLITMVTGKAIAFFEDRNHDNEASPDELVSLSLGQGASFSLVGGLQGSAVANLNVGKTGTGTLDSTGFQGGVDMSDLLSTKTTIQNVSIAGDINGSILAAGNIGHLNLRNVAGIYAGTAALGQSYSFFPNLTNGTNGGNGTITSLSSTTSQLQPAPGETGAGLSYIFADSVTVAKAGNGGFGAAGGSLFGFQINGTSSGFSLTAGDGGAADSASHRLNGGAGGSASYLFVKGFTDLTPNDVISIHGGKGGAADNLGLGGAGGAVASLYIGSSLQGGLLTPSSDFVQDDVLVKAGDGGTGQSGGLGGSLTTVSIITNTPSDPNLAAHTAAHPGLTHEINILAGNGGASTDTTTTRYGILHAGTGGTIHNLAVTDQSPETLPYDPTHAATALVQAGNAGTIAGPLNGPTALAGAGGWVYNANLIVSNLLVNAGSGSSGLNGGAGGTLLNVHLDRTSADFVHHAEFNAGNGGNGTLLNGGAGGAVLNLTTGEGDFASFLVNVTAVPNAGGFTYNPSGGNGGNSQSALGGAGGAVNALDVLDINSQIGFNPLAGDFVLNSGSGGFGGKGGGAGGAITNALFNSTNMNAIVTSGNGESATASGNGGAGGLIRNLQLNLDNNVVATIDATHPLAPVASSAHVHAGLGGTGIAYGGAGGSLVAVVARVSNSDSQLDVPVIPLAGGDASLIAGNGGAGGTGAPGVGGTVYLSGGYAATGSGTMIAGNAGSGGTRPAAGGNIQGISASALSALYAAKSITLIAGDGGAGGAGGGIGFVGYGSTSASLLPVPTGNIFVKAGAGSAVHSTAARGVDYAGAGGSILNLYGSVSSGVGALTSITAGEGGATLGGTKLGAGGYVANVFIQRGPLDDTVPAGVLTIAAGDAGSADSGQPTANFGANGGTVTGVTVGDIGARTIFRSIAAGDASAGLVYGGTGGSVLNVQVSNHDIGVKTGAVYGLTSMGGIFAGLGGAGGRLSGAAGDVKVISANSIASIAAGKTTVPALANTVAQIALNSVGHSTTLPTDSGNALTDQIEFTYHPALALVASTANSDTFERVPGGSFDFNEPAGGPTTFTLTYKGQTTVPLDASASPQQIQNALNALPAVHSAGDVSVTDPSYSALGQTAGNFTVTFNSPGAGASPLTGVGSERTAPLPGNATVAQVQTALNALQSVNDGGTNYPGIPPVTVTSPATASYEIVYGNTSATNGAVTAEHLITHSAIETTVGTGTTGSVQHLELFGVGQFRIVYTPLTGAPAVETDFLNVGASPADVATALANAGIITKGTDAVTEPGANTYDIQFANPGAVGKFQVVEYAPLSHVQEPNNAAGHEVQDLNFTPVRAVDDLVFTVQRTGEKITVPADLTTSTPVTAQQVQDALNQSAALGTADGGVTVTLTPDNVFHVKFNNTANAEAITAAEVLPAFFSTVTGVVTANTQATEETPGDAAAGTPEVQEVKLSPGTDYFKLSLDGTNYTNALPATATPDQVRAALDSISPVPHNHFDGQDATEGNVTGVPGDYTISFASTDGPQNPIQVQEIADQRDELIVSKVGSFHFANGAVHSPELSSNATATQVQAAINSVMGPNSVTVTMGPEGHGDYLIKYLDGNSDTPPQVVDTLQLDHSGVVGGAEDLTLARPAIIDEAVYQNASVVGAIADLNHLGANQFAFLATAGDATGAPGEVFHLGDTAIDGLIAAKNLSQKTLNFTPQARLIINTDVNSPAAGVFRAADPDPLHPTALGTTPVFYDFLNDLS